MLSKLKKEDENIDLHIITWNDQEFIKQSQEAFYELMITVEEIGINLSYEFQDVHDRSIVSDNGWTIVLGRGLDIYEKEESRFSLGEIDQELRKCKNFTVTYVKNKK
jgi:ATP-dependent Lon protease